MSKRTALRIGRAAARIALSASLVLLMSAAQPARAGSVLPQNGQFVAGSGSIAATASTVTVNQLSSKAIINWQSFSIGSGNIVQFNNGSGATLNRVTGNNVSQIAGSIFSTGSVYLVNQAGVIVLPGGQIVSAGSFVASTRDIADSDFLSGVNSFQGLSSGLVVNQGIITSTNGDVILVGKSVQNSGTVSAANGTAGLAAGDNVLLQPATGNQRLLIAAGSGDVTNTGTLSAAQAELNAAGGNVYALAGNNGGIVRATGTATVAGHVWLTAGGNATVSGAIAAENADGSGGTVLVKAAGTTDFSGTITATGSAAGGNGGAVEVSGAQLAFTGSVDTRAPKGTTGTLLLDPGDIYINTAGTTGDGSASAISVATLQSELGTSNVTLSATPNGSDLGNIFVQNAVAWTGSFSLTLSATASINFSSGVAISHSSGSGNLTLQGDSSGTGGTASTPTIQCNSVACGSTTNFANWSGSSGNVTIFYDPTPGNSAPTYTSASAFTSGNATTNNVNIGTTASFTSYQLINSAANLTALSGTSAAWGGSFAQSKSFVYTNTNYTPIGNATTPFSGIYDGQSHQLQNLDIESSTVDSTTSTSGGQPNGYFGLFGLISGTVKNIGLQINLVLDSYAGAGYYPNVGGLAGGLTSTGTITNTYIIPSSATPNSTAVTACGDVGAPCVSQSSSTPTKTYGFGVGGLVGLSSGTISNSFSQVSVWAAGVGVDSSNPSTTGDVGGFVGYMWGGSITDSYSAFPLPGPHGLIGKIEAANPGGSGHLIAGGFIGGVSGTVTITNSWTNQWPWSAGSQLATNKSGALIGSVQNGSTVTATGDAFDTTYDCYTGSTASGCQSSGGPWTGGGIGTGYTDTQWTTPGSIPGYSSSPWTWVSGNYPILTADYQQVSGTVFSDRGVTGVGGLLVKLLVNGTAEYTSLSGTDTTLSAVSGGNPVGFYDFWLPAGTVAGGANALTYLSGTNKGNTYTDGGVSGNLYTGLNIYYNYLLLNTVQANLSSTVTNLATALGGTTDTSCASASCFDFTISGGALSGLSSLGILASANSFTLDQAISTGSNGVLAITSNNAVTQTAAFNSANLLLLGAGGTYTLTGSGNGTSVSETGGSTTTTVAANTGSVNLTVGSSSTAATLVVGSNVGGTVAHGGVTGITASASGLAVVLDDTGGGTNTGVFQNVVGSGGIATASGKWQIWSQTPVSDTLGSLSFAYEQYGATKGIFTPTSAENTSDTLFFRATPTITIGLTGPIAKTYDGTTTATLTSGEYTASGAIGGDSVAIADGSVPTSGSYNSQNVATATTVTASGLTASDFTVTNGSATVLGYGLANTTASTTGVINPVALTITASSTSKIYGSANPSFTQASYASQLVAGDTTSTVVVSGVTFATTATTASPVGSYNITASGGSISGTSGNNYTLADATNVGGLTVTAATLTITANSTSKIYGSANPSFTQASYASQLVAGDTTSTVVVSGVTFATSATTASPVGSYNITASGGSISGTSGNNYTLADATNVGGLTVTAATLTITATSTSKIYGSANPSFTQASYASQLVAGDTTSTVVVSGVTFATTATTASPVGSYNITASGGSISGTSGNNYTLADATNVGGLTVTAATLTITANSTSKIYGSANPSFTQASYASQLVAGDTTSTVVVSGVTFATTATTASPVGSYNITASGGSISGTSGNNYTLADATNVGGLTVTAATLTITANSTSKIYGSANPSFTQASYASQLVAGDTTSTVVVSGVTFATSATTASPVGSYNITASGGSISGTSGNNYTLADATNVGGLTVTAATLTITATSTSKIYGSANPSFTQASYASQLVAGDTTSTVVVSGVTFATSATTASPVGSYNITASGGSISGTSGNNYTLADATNVGGLTVTAATLTITANSTSKIYGSANPSFTQASYASQLVAGDTTSTVVVSGVTFATTATTASPVGSYNITASGGSISGTSGNNYTLADATNVGGLTVTAATLTITANSTSKIYGSANPSFTQASYASQLVAGDTTSTVVVSGVTFATSATTASPVGSYNITASGGSISGTSGNNYTLADATNVGGLTVTAATLTITATSTSKIYGSANPSFTQASYASQLVAGDTTSTVVVSGVTFATTATTASPVGSYNITASGGSISGTSGNNYTLADATNVGGLTVTAATLTITANSTSKIYGSANPSFTQASYASQLVAGDTTSTVVVSGVTFATTATTASPVGSYNITASGGSISGTSGNNYTLADATNVGGLTVTAATLTITANSTSKIYGSANPSFTQASYASQLVAGDTTSTVVVSGVTFATSATTASPVGSYNITASGGSISGTSGNNYTLADATNVGGLTVTAATLTITATSTSKIYGSANPSFTQASYASQLVAGDTTSTVVVSGVTFATSATTASPVGSYNITASGGSISGTSGNNYTLADATNVGGLTVTAATLTITATSDSKTYNGTTASSQTPSYQVTGLGANTLYGSDTLTGLTQAFQSANALGTGGSTLVVAAYTLSDPGNYIVSLNTALGTISPAVLTLSGATANDKPYDGTNTATVSGTLSGTIYPGDSVTLTGVNAATFSQVNSGIGFAVTVTSIGITGTGSGNYIVAPPTGLTANITQVALTVTPNPVSVVYDGTTLNNTTYSDTLSSYSITGFVHSETASSVSLALNGTMNFNGSPATAVKNAGSYALTAGTLWLTTVNNNYSLSFSNPTPNAYVITPLPIVLTGTRPSDNTSTASYSILSITNVASADSGSPPTLTAGSATLAGSAVGTQSITSAAGLTLGNNASGNYTLVGATGSVTITSAGPTPLTVTGITANNKVYDGTDTVTLNLGSATLNGLVGNDQNTVTLSGAYVAVFSSVNQATNIPVTISSLGLTGTNSNNYYVTPPTNVTATITPLPVVLSGTRVYDGTTGASSAILSITNVVSADLSSPPTVASGSGTLASTNVGSQGITSPGSLALGNNGAGDYTLTGATGSVTITALAVVLTGTRVYDAATDASYSILTVTNNLDGGNLTLSGSGTLASQNVGSRGFTSIGTLSLGGSAATNYTLSQVTTNASAVTITPLIVTLSGSRTYDGTTGAPSTILTISNDLDGGNLTLSGSGTLASANAGPESITSVSGLTLGGSAAGNYTLTGATGSVTITPLAVVLTGTRAYDGTTGASYSILTITNDLDGGNLTLSGSGTLASQNVGSQGFASLGTLSLGGSAATNYTLSQITTNASAVTITVLPVVLTGTRAYDAATDASYSILTITNNLDGSNLTLSGTGTLASQNVGSRGFTSIGTLSLGGSAATNYTLSQVTTNASAVTITALPVVLTGTRVYDAATDASYSILTITNNLDAGNLTLSGSGTLASQNVGSRGFAALGTLSLGGSAATNYTLSQITTNASAVTITVLPVVLTGTRVYDAATDASYSILTITNNLDGSNLTLSGSGTLASQNVGSRGFTSIGTLSLGGSAATNYTLSQVTTNASAVTITALPVVLTGTRVYDAATDASYSILTVTNDLDGGNLTLSGSGTLASANAGPESITSVSGLTLGGSAAGNYTLTGATGSVTITPLAVVLTGTRAYDGTTGASYSILTVTNDLDGGNLTLSGSGTLASQNVGSQGFASIGTLSLGGSAATNYTLSQITTNASAVTITVLPVVLTGTRAYDAATDASYSILTITNNLDGSNLTLSGTGTLASQNVGSRGFASLGTLSLGGSAATNYTLSQVTTNASAVTITALPVVLTGTRVYDAATDASYSILTVTNNLDGGNLTLSGSGTLASQNVGSQGFAALGTLSLGGSAATNYTLSQITTNASAVTITVLPVVLTGTRTYDGTNTASSSILTITNNLDGGNLTLSGSGTLASQNLGSQLFTSVGSLLLGGSAATNYTLSQVTTNGSAVTITPAVITVTANSTSKIYGSANPSFTMADYSGQLVAGDTTSTVIVSGVVFATTATTTSPVGSYNITASGGSITGSSNYTLAYATNFGGLTINPAALTITVTNQTMGYGGQVPTLTYSLSGLVAGNTAATLASSILVTTTATSSSNVGGGSLSGGGYPITATLLPGSNYYFATNTPGALTITPVALTLTGLSVENKVYDGTTTATPQLLFTNPTLLGPSGAPVPGITLNYASAVGTFATPNADSSNAALLNQVNVGNGIPVTVTGLGLSGLASGNYILNNPILSAYIIARPLTVTGITAPNQVYNGTTKASLSFTGAVLGAGSWSSYIVSNYTTPVLTPATGGIVAADTGNVVLNTGGYTATMTSANAGVNQVMITQLALTGTAAANYIIEPPANINITVTPATLTVGGLTVAPETYDGSATATVNYGAATIAHLIGTDSVKITGVIAAHFANGTAGMNKAVTVTAVTLAANNGTTDAADYAVTMPTGLTGTIYPAPLVVPSGDIAVKEQVQNGSTTATLTITSSAALAGIVGSDAVSLNTTSYSAVWSSTATVGTSVNVSVNALHLTGAEAADYFIVGGLNGTNYTLATVDADLLLNPASFATYAISSGNHLTLTGTICNTPGVGACP